MYWLLLLPAIIISFWAQIKVSTTFDKYKQVGSFNGFSGAEVARMILDYNGLHDIPVELVAGTLSDHYDPSNRVLRLSEEVYYGKSVASIGVAAHETGHAMQHKESYGPMGLRSAIVPIANFGSGASWLILILGLFMGMRSLVFLGIILFSFVVLFQIVTLPVEFNASSRALRTLEDRGILQGEEIKGAKKVLDAAAMTYVAATIMAVVNLIRLIMISQNRD
ncbi:hypothetical protein SAMN02745163_02136 [Clostridium cavendishii DSM 21758]|uniref:Neutral zinc metallopeptidase n=1 Tax=Clostridium cavendishii DSM 21758 TaxID=1121302 RepID=A0A1M6K9R3_9CLOT|nr:zinc metallopeptidase [Clostridium cavendishii]SHJ55689.1 hypothetical protein SAMN02745163_02136 [Clostridium cavendishii DSM 21758]